MGTEWAAATPIAWDNWSTDPPEIDAAEPHWLNAKLVFGQGELMTKNGRNTLSGFLQVSVFGPADEGMGGGSSKGIFQYADDVRDIFNRVTIQDTNSFTYSEELDNAAWTKTRCSVTTNAATAPDNLVTGDKLVEDGTAGTTHLFSRNTPALTNDTQQSFSLLAKAAERTEILIQFAQKDGTNANAWFDLAAGTAGTVAGGAVGLIEKHADSWYRCMATYDSASGGTTPTVQVFLGSGSETVSYNGDAASGVYIWGMDFEVDEAFPSPYIPTVASAVTVDRVRFGVPSAPRIVPRIQAMRFMSSPNIPWVQAIVACPFTFDEEVT